MIARSEKGAGAVGRDWPSRPPRRPHDAACLPDGSLGRIFTAGATKESRHRPHRDPPHRRFAMRTARKRPMETQKGSDEATAVSPQKNISSNTLRLPDSISSRNCSIFLKSISTKSVNLYFHHSLFKSRSMVFSSNRYFMMRPGFPTTTA